MKKNVPQHIAIIPDGNRRWARQHAATIREGYTRGVKKFREIMEHTLDQAVPCATFWAASEHNLEKRPRFEISHLISLLKQELTDPRLRETMEKNKVKLQFLGRWREILKDETLAKAIHAIEGETERFTKRSLTILLGYDGKREMLTAIQNIQKDSPHSVNYGTITKSLWTGTLPPVDLIIRTGEEKPGWSHWSAGFMMWQAADSLFYTTKTLWPDFSPAEFAYVIETCTKRERRFGA